MPSASIEPQRVSCASTRTLSPIALSSATTSKGSSRAAAARFSPRWFSEEVPGISRMLGERCSSHASEHGRLQWRESSQREERDISDALLRESIDECIVIAMRHVVEVLHAHDLGNSLGLLQLPWRDVAETDVTNQSPPFQFSQRTQRFLDRSLRWRRDSTHSEVDDV